MRVCASERLRSPDAEQLCLLWQNVSTALLSKLHFIPLDCFIAFVFFVITNDPRTLYYLFRYV